MGNCFDRSPERHRDDVNECPMNAESGIFVGQADLKREALIGKKNYNGVIETIPYTFVIASLRSRRGNLNKPANNWLVEVMRLLRRLGLDCLRREPAATRNDITNKDSDDNRI